MNNLPIGVQQLFDYLKEGTSAFHVIEHSKKVLTEAGFQELKLKESWNLEKGGRYFCVPFGTTLYAFTVGAECDLSNGIHIGGAHTDFPGIKIKPNPEIFSHGYMQLNTEVYGGPILSTFFDRPLSLSGKVVTRGERYDKPVSHLLDFKAPVLYLPNLAIHMNREVNDKGAPIDNQKHLLPMLGMVDEALNKDTKFVDLLAEKLGVDAKDILDYDLCIVATMRTFELTYGNTLSHTRPDGQRFFTIINEYGFKAGYYGGTKHYGENMAYWQTHDVEAYNALIQSSGHKQNILDSRWKKMGVGTFTFYGRKYWIQLFTT